MRENIVPENSHILDWLAKEFLDVDWREEFLQKRRVCRATRDAISDISSNGSFSELEKDVYLHNALDVLSVARLQSAISASMYLLTRSKRE